MKKAVVVTLVLLSLAVAVFAAEVVKRGAPLSDAKPTPLATVLQSPNDYTKKPVLVEGVIESVCEMKGCWMEIAPEAGKPGMHVTFKDYGFFVPTDSKGMKARAEGVVELKTLSKKEADHLAGEGATIERNADGSARQVAFVASGVELTKP